MPDSSGWFWATSPAAHSPPLEGDCNEHGGVEMPAYFGKLAETQHPAPEPTTIVPRPPAQKPAMGAS